jgi:hypothetical protein
MNVELDIMSQLKNVIQETKDYDIFKKLPGNRTLSKGLIRDLIHSFTDKPQLIFARPLLVNEYFQVVDGQHRQAALMSIGHSIPYMVVPKLTVRDARLLNALQRSWTLEDFARSYAETDGGVYQQFVDLMDKYHLPPRTLLSYTTGMTSGSEHISTKFRTGEYKPRPMYDTQAWIDKLTEFAPYNRHWNEQSFATAVAQLLARDDYDHERMIRKLESSGPLIHRSAVKDYLRDLESVYNTQNPASSGGRYTRFV